MNPVVIVPFHDPRWLDNTLSNLARAKLPAVLVLNGAARRLSPGLPTLLSDDNQASALNVGIEWARLQGFTHALSFDSDDYYGPSYAPQALGALREVDVVGRTSIFAKLQDGSLHFFPRPGRALLFATIGFRLAPALAVHNILDSCEDWSKRMRAAGCTGRQLDASHYCYRRHGSNKHWYLPRDALVRAAWGPSLCFGNLPEATVDADPSDPVWRQYSVSPGPSDAEILAAL